MDNQHQKITGYRDLTAVEIALVNRVKAHAIETESLITSVRDHLREQNAAARGGAAVAVDKVLDAEVKYTNEQMQEMARLDAANPGRWASIAQTDFQTAFMALNRAVMQPTTF